MLAMLLERAQLDPDVAAIRDESVPKACSGLVGVLEAGIRAGALPIDLGIGEALAQLVGPCVHRLLANGKPLTAPFVDEVVDFFLHRFENQSIGAITGGRTVS
jgi:hypothetical protein